MSLTFGGSFGIMFSCVDSAVAWLGLAPKGFCLPALFSPLTCRRSRHPRNAPYKTRISFMLIPTNFAVLSYLSFFFPGK